MKYTIFISLLIFNISLFGQTRGVYVNKTTNVVVAPVYIDEFKEANDIASKSYVDEKADALELSAVKTDMVPKSSLSILVDLYRDGMAYSAGNVYSNSSVYGSYYSDCVLKVLNPEGEILYFFSTVLYWSEYLQEMHAGEDIYDEGATVYYYPTGRNNTKTNNTTNLRAKQLFPSSEWATHCIASYEESYSGQYVYNGVSSVKDNKIRITAIQIYPSAKYHSIFLNSENTIVVHRQTMSTAEVDGNGHHLFRPALIQYLR